MINEEMKNWIDNASYEELLRKWRFDPSGPGFFQGEIGLYFQQKMSEKKNKLSHEEQVRISKAVGLGTL